ncbi:hypothetical protein WG904_07105 [Pedobacter sp. Du54]|uniref:hypothetical protein n=1 Tax=Pedobacter anseongensis TaxID=3133439 RepID=UPI0030A56EE0
MHDKIEETDNQETTPTLIVTEDMRSYIYDTTKWTNFLAIFGFVVSGFLVLTAFTIGPAMTTDPKLAEAMAASKLSPVVLTISCLIFAFAVFYPSLLLFKYTSKAKLGVLYGEQASLNEAFGKIKSLFKFWGIITLIGSLLYVMLIILTAIG